MPAGWRSEPTYVPTPEGLRAALPPSARPRKGGRLEPSPPPEEDAASAARSGAPSPSSERHAACREGLRRRGGGEGRTSVASLGVGRRGSSTRVRVRVHVCYGHCNPGLACQDGCSSSSCAPCSSAWRAETRQSGSIETAEWSAEACSCDKKGGLDMASSGGPAGKGRHSHSLGGVGQGKQGARAVAVRVHVLEVGHEPRPGEADRDDEWAEQEQELAVPQQQLLVRRCDLEHLPPADRLGAGPLHDSVLGEADGARDRKAGRRAASERLQAVRLQAVLVHKLVGADAL